MARDGQLKMILNDSDFDDELEMLAVVTMAMRKLNTENSSTIRRRFIQGHSVIFCNQIEGHERLYYDYFAKLPTYPPNLFWRKFRMNRSLFVHILSMMEVYDLYFVQKKDALGNIGLSPLQKMTAAIRMFAYGVAANAVDDYVKIGESTTIESLQIFVLVIVTIYSDEYLRSPNSTDISRLLTIGERHGFPRMLDSIDHIHWRWKNCPTVWKGRAPPVNYSVNGNDYIMGYYLADSIYLKWVTFVKIISSLRDNKQIHFAQVQESTRKDVERAFGVLQAQFTIVHRPTRFWKLEVLKDIMKTWRILHNMIVEDERDGNEINFGYDASDEIPTPTLISERSLELLQFIHTQHYIKDKDIHSRLQTDLVEHLWITHGMF